MSGGKLLASILALALVTAMMPARVSAGDLAASFDPDAGQPIDKVEFATGWYIRGDAGAEFTNMPKLSSDLSYIVPNTRTSNWSIEAGAGYKFTNFFRVDSTFSYYGDQTVAQKGDAVGCYSELRAQDITVGGTTVPHGIYAVPSYCKPVSNARLRKFLLLLNGYVDLGTWNGITPYVGAGVGSALLYGNSNYALTNASDGSPYRATLTQPSGYPAVFYNQYGTALSPQPKIAYGTQNYDRSATNQKFGFAWAVMAGFAYDLTRNMKLDIGYRFVNFGTLPLVFNSSGQPVTQRVTSHEVRAGIRYMID